MLFKSLYIAIDINVDGCVCVSVCVFDIWMTKIARAIVYFTLGSFLFF